MCMLKTETQKTLTAMLEEWSAEGRVFDTIMVRDALRGKCPTDTNVTYNEVFPLVWHTFRKGTFKQPYIVRTKRVRGNPKKMVMMGEERKVAGKVETTPEYVPETGVILKKVQDRWNKARAV